jgi:ABC-type branched-subunit amino acid transport system substrate-binding protein
LESKFEKVIMKRFLRLPLGLILLVAAAACTQPTATPTPTPEDVVTVGFTTSETGVYANESLRQANGIKLWVQQVNDAGGIRLANGQFIKVAMKTYDDASDPLQADAMYKKLIANDDVDFLFGPYSSELTNPAAAIANQNGRILISAGAASDIGFQRNFKTVYQVYTPASRYLVPALEIISAVDSDARRLAFLYESETFATIAALSISNELQSRNLFTIYTESYRTGTTDFSSFVQKIGAVKPDVILAGGHTDDGKVIAQELARQGVTAKIIVLLDSASQPAFSSLGASAIGFMGPSQWEPDSFYTTANATMDGLAFYGTSGTEFNLAYQQTYGAPADSYAAGGYAAGLVLQHAIEQAGTLNRDDILAALDDTNILTFFGRLQFDTSTKNHGMQIGHEVVYVQWQLDTAANLVKRVVWPVDLANAPLTYPKP